MNKITDVTPNVMYELDDTNINPDDVSTWKDRVKGYKTPFRKFFVKVSDEVWNIYHGIDTETGSVEISDEELLSAIDTKYKELGWEYGKISQKERSDISWEIREEDKEFYVEILYLENHFDIDNEGEEIADVDGTNSSNV